MSSKLPFSVSTSFFGADTAVSSISRKTTCKSSFKLPLTPIKLLSLNPFSIQEIFSSCSWRGRERTRPPPRAVSSPHFPTRWLCDQGTCLASFSQIQNEEEDPLMSPQDLTSSGGST